MPEAFTHRWSDRHSVSGYPRGHITQEIAKILAEVRSPTAAFRQRVFFWVEFRYAVITNRIFSAGS